jgi:guanine deaminase
MRMNVNKSGKDKPTAYVDNLRGLEPFGSDFKDLAVFVQYDARAYFLGSDDVFGANSALHVVRECIVSTNAMSSKTPQDWMRHTVELAVENVREGRGGPFAAIVVKDDEIVGSGVNSVTATNDPTAHGEIMAIRAACRTLNSFQLTGCELYTSCEPCPMCLGAIYWARPTHFYFCATRKDAAVGGFDDDLIYSELLLHPEQRAIPGYCVLNEMAQRAFSEWHAKAEKLPY